MKGKVEIAFKKEKQDQKDFNLPITKSLFCFVLIH